MASRVALAGWPGQINLNSASASIGSYGVTYAVALSGKLTGSGGLIIRPEGGSAASHTATFTLSNSGNNYAGSTTMQVGTAQLSSTLKLGALNALPVTTTLNLNRLASSGVVYFDLAGFNQTVSGLNGNFVSNAVINSSGTLATLTVSNAADSTFSSFIGVAGKANLALVKKGTGPFPLSGVNIYTGATTVGAGTLLLNGNITATSGFFLSNNATLQLTLGPTANRTNIVVFGNANLAGAISLNDSGILRPVTPTLTQPAMSNGIFSLGISGAAGPDYQLWASTNLTGWSLLGQRNSPALPFVFQDFGATNYPQRFYRIQLAP